MKRNELTVSDVHSVHLWFPVLELTRSTKCVGDR